MLESFNIGIRSGIESEKADARELVSRLRARHERPRRRRTAAEQGDELAATDHSITSSARASSVGGTSRPSALAVTRLMAKSNIAGCIMGKLAALSPFRMRPAYNPSCR